MVAHPVREHQSTLRYTRSLTDSLHICKSSARLVFRVKSVRSVPQLDQLDLNVEESSDQRSSSFSLDVSGINRRLFSFLFFYLFYFLFSFLSFLLLLLPPPLPFPSFYLNLSVSIQVINMPLISRASPITRLIHRLFNTN